MLCSVVRVRDAQLHLDQVAEFVAAFQEDAALDALGYDIDETGQCVLVVPPNCLFFVVKFYDFKEMGEDGGSSRAVGRGLTAKRSYSFALGSGPN